MNLIEKLGDYEKAKEIIDQNIKDFGEECGEVGIYHPNTGWIVHEDLQSCLLEYRRENDIFEVGDVVVGRCYSDFDDALLTITKKFTHDGKPCIVFECTRTICDDFESEVRHAKPEELEAGHRL